MARCFNLLGQIFILRGGEEEEEEEATSKRRTASTTRSEWCGRDVHWPLLLFCLAAGPGRPRPVGARDRVADASRACHRVVISLALRGRAHVARILDASVDA